MLLKKLAETNIMLTANVYSMKYQRIKQFFEHEFMIKHVENELILVHFIWYMTNKGCSGWMMCILWI
jgi:hypothetical protein